MTQQPSTSNVHVPQEIVDKWCNYLFKGRPFTLEDGKTYIRAYSKTFEQVHWYDFDLDFFWHDRPMTKVEVLKEK